jgi:hypothetical protein
VTCRIFEWRGEPCGGTHERSEAGNDGNRRRTACLRSDLDHTIAVYFGPMEKTVFGFWSGGNGKASSTETVMLPDGAVVPPAPAFTVSTSANAQDASANDTTSAVRMFIPLLLAMEFGVVPDGYFNGESGLQGNIELI